MRKQSGADRRTAKQRIADVIANEQADLTGTLDFDYIQERMAADVLWSLLHTACAISDLDTDKVYARCEIIVNEMNSEFVDLHFVISHMQHQLKAQMLVV